jgi:XTP/dITP diphosphohydrolase
VKEIVVATRNKNKVKEIRKILKDLKVKILTLDDFSNIPEIVEDGMTFEENASKKASIISRFTQRLTIADDSGLEVEVLGGKPGVKSSRFAGDKAGYAKNNAKLLRLLKGVPLSKRKAKFVCVISVAKGGRVLNVVRGTCSGRIGFEPKGKTGFGYDPLFISPKYGKTFSELGSKIKNRISHRYKALKKAKVVIKSLLDF